MSIVEGLEQVDEGELDHSEKRVGPLELFFDLVFVFALTQVTKLMADNSTWEGLGQGLLVLAALWWAWGAYAWLTNYIEADEGVERLLMFAVMAAFLVAALAVPHAFDDDALIFALAYATARWLHIFLFAEANDDVDAAQAIRRLARTAIPGPGLLIVAAFLEGPAQTAVWIVALTIDFAGPYVFGVRGFRVSPGHFAERFSLIVIIALGESIVAIGAGLPGDLDAGLVVAAVVGLTVACALWWAYFDVVAIVAERKLREAEGAARATLARDSYSFLHFPMVAGIVLFAFGLKKTLGDFADELGWVPSIGLFGGLSLYLLAHVAFRLRNVGSVNRRRLLAAAVLVALVPVGAEAPSLAALALAATVCAALIAYETIRFREDRARVRRAREATA
jgi:low temperature requirement protein LtrA